MKLKPPLKSFLLGLLLIVNLSFAQGVKQNFRNISAKDGLSHSDVMDVTQDDKGFIWIGTLAGLNKYDGHAIKRFSNKNYLIESVYKNRINRMVCKDNYIWLATQGGLDCFNIETEKYVKINWLFNDSVFTPNTDIKSVFVSDRNMVYIISVDTVKAFKVLEASQSQLTLKELTIRNLPNNGDFLDMQSDENGLKWLLSENNLYYLDDSDSEIKIKSAEVSDGNVIFSDFFGFYTTETNYLLIGVEKGFLKANTSFLNSDVPIKLSTTFYEIETSAIQSGNTYNTRFVINRFVKGINNNIWLGSSYGLIEASLTSQGYKYAFYNNYNENLTTSGVVGLFRDRSDCLWVSNYQGGVNCTDLYQKNFYSLKYNPGETNSLSENYVRAIVEDENENIWIGTEKTGLNYYNFSTGKFSFLRRDANSENSLISDGVRSLLVDNKNRLWIGTMDGISIYSPDNGKYFNITKDGSKGKALTNNVVFTMDKDKFGNIWAGSWHSGLNRISFKNENDFEVENIYKKSEKNSIGLSSNVITYIYADDFFPEVFIGTDKGLNHVFLNEDGSIKHIASYKGDNSKANTLSSDFIWPTIRENDSVLWVGTLGGGLNRLVINKNSELGYRATAFSIEEGAPSADIETIIFNDKKKELWLGGVGLSKFDLTTKRFDNYDEEDGLSGNSFKVGSATKGESGRYYFGGTEGLTYFYPDKIVNNEYLPKIVLTDLIVNNKPVSIAKESESNINLNKAITYQEEIALSHTENNFQIHFTSDHYAKPNKTKFKYKLVGYDKDWVFVDAKDRKASFTNLPYGSYVFQVTGTNSDGIWTNDIRSLRINVLAPWWLTKWAKVGYIFLFIGFLTLGFFAIVRWFKLKKAYEVSVIEEEQKEIMYQLRDQFFTNISHEFKTPLTLIFNPLERLLSKENINVKQRNSFYKIMLKNAERLLKLINELIDYRKVSTNVYKLNLEEHNLVEFVNEIKEFFESTLRKKEITLEIKETLNKRTLQFDMSVLEKILFNIIGNAIKFSPEKGKVSVSLSESPFSIDKNLTNTITIDSEFDAPENIYIAIKDEGVGIGEQQIEHIFDRFFQSEKANIGGSGIGLTLVKSLVQLHKIKLTVFSQLKKGTVFLLAIPNIDYHTVFPQLAIPGSVRLSEKVKTNLETLDIKESKQLYEEDLELYENFTKPEILIVEDNEELRGFIKDDFQEHFNVLTASNGIEALAMLESNNIQAIISDIMMPEMDGIELCKKVKSSHLYKHIPFVLLTAKFKVESQIEGMQSGADTYIPKPFSLDVLRLHIYNLLKNKQELKEKIVENSFEEARKITTEKCKNKFLKQVIDTIDENIEDVDFDVSRLSEILGVSKSTLYNSVKSLTSESIGVLIRKIRLKKAAQILSNSDLNIIQVMDKVGIQSQSHFTKSFKKEFGKTPSEFKRSL